MNNIRLFFEPKNGSKPFKSIATGDLKPGNAISTDQYSSSGKGRLDSGFGKTDSKLLMSGGTIFVDHASGFIHVANHVTLGASDTITSKRRFEQMVSSGGVKIAQYRANNSIFSSREFEEEIERTNQAISFSGVGAQHQNGIAERRIRKVVERAHMMLIHATMKYPDVITSELWPFALEYSAYLWNITPKLQHPPEEVFYRAKMDYYELHQAHVWGYPTYALN